MSYLNTAVALVGIFAQASGWTLTPAAGDHGPVLALATEAVSYRFECTASAIVVTETGVTKLIDLKTGNPIGDGPDAVMPSGAAVMALFAGRGDPAFQPATAVKNPAGGWDLTIRLPKDDEQLKAVGKSELISLFTTGYTMAVTMDDQARATWNDYIKRCQAWS